MNISYSFLDVVTIPSGALLSIPRVEFEVNDAWWREGFPSTNQAVYSSRDLQAVRCPDASSSSNKQAITRVV
jgi:hypothetical protein